MFEKKKNVEKFIKTYQNVNGMINFTSKTLAYIIKFLSLP